MSFLTHNQQRIIDIILASPNPPSYADIAGQLGMTRQGVSHNVKRLKRLKYLKSKPFVPNSLKVIKTGEDHDQIS